MDVHTFHPYFVQIPQVGLGRAVTTGETKQVISSLCIPWLDGILQSQHNLLFVLEQPPLPFWRIGALSTGTTTARFVVTFKIQ